MSFVFAIIVCAAGNLRYSVSLRSCGLCRVDPSLDHLGVKYFTCLRYPHSAFIVKFPVILVKNVAVSLPYINETIMLKSNRTTSSSGCHE